MIGKFQAQFVLTATRMRIFLPPEDFETLVRELVARCSEGTLADALNGLRGLYGDL